MSAGSNTAKSRFLGSRGIARKRRTGASYRRPTVETLEERTLLAVNLIEVGDPVDRLRLIVQAGAVRQEDVLPLNNLTFPINIVNRPFEVDIMDEGMASGTLTGTIDTRPDGSLGRIDLFLGVSGQGVDGPGVVSGVQAVMSGTFSIEFEVVGAPVDVTWVGSASTMSIQGGNQAIATLFPFDPVIVRPTSPLTVLPINLPFNQTLTLAPLDPGLYRIQFGVDAVVGLNVAGDSHVQATILFGNSPPVLQPIGNKFVNEGDTLSFTATATDDGESLTFSLDQASRNAGMRIDPATGFFTWTPMATPGPGTYTVTVTVTDDDSPALSDSETFTITVGEPDGEVFHWTNTAGGSFNDVDNWDADAIPEEDNDLALFDLPGSFGSTPYVVSFASNAHNGKTIVSERPVDFDLNGNSYGVFAQSGDSGLEVADTLLTLRGGDEVLTGPLDIAAFPGESAEIEVRQGTRLVSSDIVVASKDPSFPSGSIGTLTITRGGQVDVSPDNVFIGRDGNGFVHVFGPDPDTGTPSRLDGDRTVFVGRDGPGLLQIADGGQVSFNRDAWIGISESGRVLVEGVNPNTLEPSLLDIGFDLVLGDGGEGTLEVTDGGAVSASRGIVGHLIGSPLANLIVRGLYDAQHRSRLSALDVLIGAENLPGAGGPNGLLQILGGGEGQAAELTLGIGNAGGVLVSGMHTDGFVQGSTLDVTGQTLVGQKRNGTYTVSNGAEATSQSFVVGNSANVVSLAAIEGVHANGTSSFLDIAGNLLVGANTNNSAGGSATLTILNGGGVRADSMIVGNNPGSLSRVNVVGFDGAFPSSLLVAGDLTVGETSDALLNVDLGGQVEVFGTVIVGTSVIDGGGQVQVTGAGSTFHAYGNMFLGGGITQAGLLVRDGGEAFIDGQLIVQPNGVVAGNNAVVHVGSLIDNGGLINRGLIREGNSPGVLTIDGDLVNEGIIEIEIAGPTPGTDYDQLIATGDVQQGGTLKLVFLDGYVPGPGETFEFIVADSITGDFSDVEIEGMPAGLAAEVTFGPTGAAIEVSGSLLPPTVRGVVINSGAAQRSNIEQLAIQFNQPVNLQALIDSGGIIDAVRVKRLALDATHYRYDANSYTLTIDLTVDGFGGSRATRLTSGNHKVKLDTTHITARNSPLSTLVDDDGKANGVWKYRFHQMLGDLDGNHLMNRDDRDLLFAHLGSEDGDARYDFAFDLNGDGRIDRGDVRAWKSFKRNG